jgi:hypothetical protein
MWIVGGKNQFDHDKKNSPNHSLLYQAVND